MVEQFRRHISPKVDQSPIRQRTSPDVPIPNPELRPRINSAKAAEWLEQETRPAVREIKQKLIESVQHISFEDLREGLAHGVESLCAAIDNRPYAVMYGEKPHASERWVHQLIKPQLPTPTLQTWFKGDYSPVDYEHFHQTSGKVQPRKECTDTKIFAQQLTQDGVNTFVFLDDISYSGKQLIEAITRFVHFFKQHYPEVRPHIIVYIPFATHRAEQALVKKPQQHPYSAIGELFKDVDLTVIPPFKRLRTVEETLSAKELSALPGGRLNETDEKRFPRDACLTYADHKMPDHWSFPNAIGSRIGLAEYQHAAANRNPAPYKHPESPYFTEELKEWEHYQRTYVHRPIEKTT